jgi:hypothetical protein
MKCKDEGGMMKDEWFYGEDFTGERDCPRGEGEGNQAVWGVSDETSRIGGVGCTTRMKAEL